MRLVIPKVEEWVPGDNWVDHVARCARVCYKSNREDGNEQMVDNLFKAGHLSMFRHRSIYWALPESQVNWENLYALGLCNPYIRVKKEGSEGVEDMVFVSTNGQFLMDHRGELANCGLTEDNQTTRELFSQTPGAEIMRHTFWIRTQVSTSRELNRISPNNIAEQSTRYCKYTLSKFKGEPAICTPWWFDLHGANGLEIDDEILVERYPGETLLFTLPDGRTLDWKNLLKGFASKWWDDFNSEQIKVAPYQILYEYLLATVYSTDMYKNLASNDNRLDMAPQDARGVLPLDTCTEVAYTYFRDEWERFIDNRYHGLTGNPHPNAKLVAEVIGNKLGIIDTINI